MGIITLLSFLGILIGSYFIIGKTSPVQIKSAHESEFDDIVAFLNKAHDPIALITADEWMEEFIMFWEEELSEEQISHYKQMYKSIRDL